MPVLPGAVASRRPQAIAGGVAEQGQRLLRRHGRPADRRLARGGGIGGEQRFLLRAPLELPDAEADHRRHGEPTRMVGMIGSLRVIRPACPRGAVHIRSDRAARLADAQAVDGQAGADRRPDRCAPTRAGSSSGRAGSHPRRRSHRRSGSGTPPAHRRHCRRRSRARRRGSLARKRVRAGEQRPRPHRGHSPSNVAAASDGAAPGPAPRSSAVRRRAPAAPDVDGDEQEQPHDVDEVPVPGGRLEAEMLLGGEVALVGAARQTIRKMVPMMTWEPWKPVAMKKVAP